MNFLTNFKLSMSIYNTYIEDRAYIRYSNSHAAIMVKHADGKAKKNHERKLISFL